jgi:hypothetical protein
MPWLRSTQSLLTKHDQNGTHLLQLSSRITTTGLNQISSGSSARPRLSRMIDRMTKPNFSQRYLISHTSVWSSSPDHPPDLKKNRLWVDRTHVYQVIFITEQPIGASSLSSYPGQTSCLSPSGTFLWEVTKPLYGKHDAVSCGKRLAKFLCGSPA